MPLREYAVRRSIIHVTSHASEMSSACGYNGPTAAQSPLQPLQSGNWPPDAGLDPIIAWSGTEAQSLVAHGHWPRRWHTHHVLSYRLRHGSWPRLGEEPTSPLLHRLVDSLPRSPRHSSQRSLCLNVDASIRRLLSAPILSPSGAAWPTGGVVYPQD